MKIDDTFWATSLKVRSTDFIRTKEGKIYLPRPMGWIHGMGLQTLFRQAINEQIHIASPELWQRLKEENEMLTLIRLVGGGYTVCTKEEQENGNR